MQCYKTDSSLNSIFLTLTLPDYYFLVFASASSSEPAEPSAFISELSRLSITLTAAGLLTKNPNRWHLHVLSPYFIKPFLVRALTFKTIAVSEVVTSGRAQSVLSTDLRLDADEGEGDEPHLYSPWQQPAGCSRTPAISASVVFPFGENELRSDFASKYIPNHISLCYTLHFKSSNY